MNSQSDAKHLDASNTDQQVETAAEVHVEKANQDIVERLADVGAPEEKMPFDEFVMHLFGGAAHTNAADLRNDNVSKPYRSSLSDFLDSLPERNSLTTN